MWINIRGMTGQQKRDWESRLEQQIRPLFPAFDVWIWYTLRRVGLLSYHADYIFVFPSPDELKDFVHDCEKW